MKKGVKIWRKNFAIKSTSFYLAQEALEMFYEFQSKTTGRKEVKEGIWLNVGDENTGTYFLKDQLRDLVEDSMEKVINRTDAMFSLHRQTAK